MITRILFLSLVLCLEVSFAQVLKPYEKNPSYWQYKGEPVLLLGASDNDNLFQSPDFDEQLYRLKSAGGNYIRCTLSSRDAGDLQPHRRTDSGLYDLNELDETYKNNLERLISLASKLDIIVQIEVWDRFDYSRGSWETSSFNPANTTSYTFDETGFAEAYPEHPYTDKQPFFHTIKGLPHYNPKLENVLRFQKIFVEKILDISLEYYNVLYCMNNETSTPKEWGQFWMHFIDSVAAKKGKDVFVTDMFDEFFKPRHCSVCREAIRSPEIYGFLDVSQINGRNFEQSHWDTLRWIMNEVESYKRPVNCTKVYGGGNSGWGSGTFDDGVERFIRNIFGGTASARFHRPTSGTGLSERAVNAIRTIRLLEQHEPFWNMEPDLNLLSDREDNEAYPVRNKKGSVLFIYFPSLGEVTLKTDGLKLSENFTIDWLDVSYGCFHESQRVKRESEVSLRTPVKKGCIAILYN